MNEGQKNDNADEPFLTELFSSFEKDKNDQLYKKTFYVLEEEIANKKDHNSIKFKHDILLKKLMLDDYCNFPPKKETKEIILERRNSSGNNNEIGSESYVDIENELIKDLQRINYLTFSSFGAKFLDNPVGSDNCIFEDERKLRKMINFDYENFELNDELIFNICNGYVDINKLSEENMITNQQDGLSKINIINQTISPDEEEIDSEKLFLFRENMKKMRENITDGDYSIIDQEEEKVNQMILNCTKKQINLFLTVYFDTFKAVEEEEIRKSIINKINILL